MELCHQTTGACITAEASAKVWILKRYWTHTLLKWSCLGEAALIRKVMGMMSLTLLTMANQFFWENLQMRNATIPNNVMPPVTDSPMIDPVPSPEFPPSSWSFKVRVVAGEVLVFEPGMVTTTTVGEPFVRAITYQRAWQDGLWSVYPLILPFFHCLFIVESWVPAWPTRIRSITPVDGFRWGLDNQSWSSGWQFVTFHPNPPIFCVS